jgi:lysophospholipase L1-like esterase
MSTQFFLSVTIACFHFFSCKKDDTKISNTMDTTQKQITYLALGDSYTIGESVMEQQRFPAQTIQWLQANNFIASASIDYVAKTGFTCEELEQAIASKNINKTFDVVSLLIGVNDQYRGYNINLYEERFAKLLQKAIVFANNKNTHVFILSIPDWGVTPFAANRNQQQIAREIDAYNAINKRVAAVFGVNYINITASTREAKNNRNLVAADGLHPSDVEYKKWANMLAPLIKEKVL